MIEPQVVITPIKSTELHGYWPFIEQGLVNIQRKVRPDWIPADVYGALRADAATCCIVTRATRWLGFFIWHKQERPWSHLVDVFVWAVYSIPFRDRRPGDDVDEAMQRGIEYLHNVKSLIGANRVIMITSSQRKGWARKYGLKPIYTTYEV
jgi:hypothetical protein